MQRRKISGADIKADASGFVSGNLNAEKCIAYLRGIGVEIDDATAESWLDAQGVFRFLKSEETPWRTGWLHSCSCGEMHGFSEKGRGSKWARWWKKRKKRGKAAKCESCGTGFCGQSRLYDVLRGGGYRDFRKQDDRWQPIAEYVADMSAIREEDDDDES